MEARAKVQSSESRVQGFRDLLVWQRVMALEKTVYAITQTLPKEELYALTQIHRSVVSVPFNLAEGSFKRSTREFIRFLNIAYGSLAEVKTQLQLVIKKLNSEL